MKLLHLGLIWAVLLCYPHLCLASDPYIKFTATPQTSTISHGEDAMITVSLSNESEMPVEISVLYGDDIETCKIRIHDENGLQPAKVPGAISGFISERPFLITKTTGFVLDLNLSKYFKLSSNHTYAVSFSKKVLTGGRGRPGSGEILVRSNWVFVKVQ